MLNFLPSNNGELSIYNNFCANNSEKKTGASGCVLIGIGAYYAHSTLILWWFMFSIELFIKIPLGKYQPSQKRNQISHTIVLSVSLLGLIIGLAYKSFVPLDLIGFCGPDQSTGIDWWLVYYPIAVVVSVSILFVSITIIVIVKTAYIAGSLHHTWRTELRIIALLIIFVVIFVFVLNYRYYVNNNQDIWTQSTTSWLTCILNGNTTCGTVPMTRPNPSQIYGLEFIAVSSGILAFLVFGTMTDNYELWSALLKGAVYGDLSSHKSVTLRKEKNISSAKSVKSTTVQLNDITLNNEGDNQPSEFLRTNSKGGDLTTDIQQYSEGN